MNTLLTNPKRDAPPSSGLRRLVSIIGPNGPIPVSRSTWWAGVRSGRFPTPVYLGNRLTAWREEDIRKLVEEGVPRPGLATRSGGKR
ncbi:AlpA family phage regulatory protein [Bradyrhizobium sp. OAE829]|uniref:helix-turn-helix transcriptional regulator n=1 Tax=Bradyrhizobium sp. OAE829 TaxID=2663807 RepID=UPI00178A2F6C